MMQIERRAALRRRRSAQMAATVIFSVPCLMSVGAGLMMLGLSLKAVQLGAGFRFLGFIAFLRSVGFLFGSLGLGALSDRIGKREYFAALGCFLHVGAALFLAASASLWVLTLAGVCLAFTESLLWPTFEAWLGEHTRTGRRRRWLGVFNVGWCSGFALGTSLTGVAKEMELELPFYAAGVACLLGAALALGMTQAGQCLRNEEDTGDSARVVQDQSVWMRLSWVANFGNVFSLAAILNLFPKQGLELRFSEGLVGFLCGAVVMGELVAFVFTGLTVFWQGRLSVLGGAQGIAALGLLLLGRVENAAVFATVFLAVGVAVGIGFSSSLFFSVSSEHGRGLKTAIHEGMAALGALSSPPLGGALADTVGRRLPHLLCGLVLLSCILAESRILKRSKGGTRPH